MGFKPTPEQMAPVELAASGHNLIVSAYAGTGKSTTLGFIADKLSNKKILYVTFGKENIISARKKFPDNVSCLTAHSIAYRYMDKKISMMKNDLLISNLGVSDILHVMGAGNTKSWDEREWDITQATRVVNVIACFCKSIDMQITTGHLEPSEHPPSKQEASQVVQIARKYWDLAYKGKVRLTHDMYLKMWHVSKPALPYDVILFDEAQDADLLMIDVVMRQDAQIIAVGDTHQQIYSFRGAVNALPRFNIERKTELTQSFRYGQRTAALANDLLYKHKGINPGIRGNPRLRTQVERFYRPHNVIIGRTVKSLFKEMFAMQEGGFEDFACLGDNKGMMEVLFAISALRSGKQVRHPFISTFNSFEEFQVYCKHSQNEAIPTYDAIRKKHGLKPVIGLLKRLGSSRKNKVVLLTAHKCKGLEFDDVTLLDDFTNIDHKSWNEEETNLAYVAATRAMQTLNIGGCTVFDGIGVTRRSKYG